VKVDSLATLTVRHAFMHAPSRRIDRADGWHVLQGFILTALRSVILSASF
jgi:hypothetical protein